MPFKDGEPDLSDKQKRVLQICRQKNGRKKVILMSGVRKSGKSVGGLNAIADHAYNVKDASILVLTYTAGMAATSGIWNELTEVVLPDWIVADFGMNWAEKGEPRIHGATKKMMCSVTNKHGGVSKIELDSLDDEREVERKYKSRYYTMIYWSEAGEFREMKSFRTLMLALRKIGALDDEFVFLIDTNPADEGESHFLYKLFYEFRTSAEVTDPDDKVLQECLHLIEWNMDDNPYISDTEKSLVRSTYKSDPALWSRYIEGKWVKVVTNGLFKDVFNVKHMVGDIKDIDPEILVPEEGCSELIRGHDAGGVNPVSYIIEKVILHLPFKDRDNQEVMRPVSFFKFLDELAFIGEDISPEEFTILLLQKSDEWERIIGGGPVIWKDWADRSALDVKESIAQRTVAAEMFSVSRGKINLVGVEKGRGSVSNRVRLWRKLLIQGRILISTSKCPKLVEMNQNIKRGKVDGTIAVHSPYKHPFDAASYAIVKECWEELQDDIMVLRGAKSIKQPGELISLKL